MPTVAGQTQAPTPVITLTPTQPTNSPTVPTFAPTLPPILPSNESLVTLIQARASQITSNLLQSQQPDGSMATSKVYTATDLMNGVQAAINGIAGSTFISDGVEGKLNLAAFLAESMEETILYDACDENSWDNVGGGNIYPAANACGQLGQDYASYHCSAAEAAMECPALPGYSTEAVTNAQWYGAPAPLFCAPVSQVPQAPGWNINIECNEPWASPPQNCSVYPGQKAGGFDYSQPYPNAAGQTTLENCCWWGRGVIQLSGPCNIGKLNYFLGAAAAGRGLANTPFPDVDFCADPEVICSSTKYPELKWVSGLFYWMTEVQSYDSGGWSYQAEISALAANADDASARAAFINGVSGIVNRGSPFATDVDGGATRASNFELAWAVIGPTALAIVEGGNGEVILPQQPSSGNMAGTAGAMVGGVAAVALVVVARKRTRANQQQQREASTTTEMTAKNPTFNHA